ncbi:ribonuclease R [Lactococcus fujiensis]|uniref:ribonuclease R n=1 Tax=Lactococcus fujiensis TaxID=610251 RepID=UPI000BDF8F89|nr:ribonuclease R [Lactococcus fujiensis]
MKLSDVLVVKQEKVTGVFRANAKGFGFVKPLDATNRKQDVFIGSRNTLNALDGDEVLVEILHTAEQSKKGADGKIVKITKRATVDTVGTYIPFATKNEAGLLGQVLLYNDKITAALYITSSNAPLLANDVVRVHIDQYPNKKDAQSFRGVITEVIGHQGDVGLDILEVLCAMGIPESFPDEVMEQANAISEAISDEERIGRVDYRDEITYTIDGADSKDLDDAIHIKKLGNGNYELGVHIADVAHYVTEGSPLDEEALSRATSVYVADRVVPMLPERLSNGICSLNEGVERLTQSCVMEISPQGKILSAKINPSIIRTTYRMTYDDVNLMIDKNAEKRAQFSKIKESVEIATELHDILYNMRLTRGAIEFDDAESKIILDDKGVPINIVKRERGVAERMIESFMLAANETVAHHFISHKLPAIYRVHDEPKKEAFAKLIEFAGDLGYSISSPSHQSLEYFMESIQETPEEAVLSTMLLHTMSTALYSEENTHHFGLAANDYTHFTSPIRRYPDLLVHRLLHFYGEIGSSPEQKKEWEEKIPPIAKQSSEMERREVVTERIVDAMKKAEYMTQFIGDSFYGTINGIQKFGIFVQLDNSVEGLIRLNLLKGEQGDRFEFDEDNQVVIGSKSKTTFKMGQPIKVKVIATNKRKGAVDFEHLLTNDKVEQAGK